MPRLRWEGHKTGAYVPVSGIPELPSTRMGDKATVADQSMARRAIAILKANDYRDEDYFVDIYRWGMVIAIASSHIKPLNGWMIYDFIKEFHNLPIKIVPSSTNPPESQIRSLPSIQIMIMWGQI